MKGLCHYYIKLHENEKNQKLIDFLGKLEFNQMVIFVKSVSRCLSLCKLLIKENFLAIEGEGVGGCGCRCGCGCGCGCGYVHFPALTPSPSALTMEVIVSSVNKITQVGCVCVSSMP